MVLKKNKGIAKVLSLIVAIAGVTVIIGWIFDVSLLKSISPAWVSMKFDAAVAFVLSGVTLYYISRAIEGEFDVAQVVLSVTSLIIILLMGTLFFSAMLGVHTGIEDLFVKEITPSAKTLVPGRPSVPTMLNFILIAIAGLLTTLIPERLQVQLKIIGVIVAAVGAVAVIGYIVNIQLLCYFIKGVNAAMACHTAILFVLLGIGLTCLSD